MEHLVCEVSQSKIKSEAPQMENGKEQDLLYPKTICLQLKDFPDYYQFNLCSVCDWSDKCSWRMIYLALKISVLYACFAQLLRVERSKTGLDMIRWSSTT